VQASLESLPWRLGTILSRGAFLRERVAQACGWGTSCERRHIELEERAHIIEESHFLEERRTLEEWRT
jgi:hypothetical protein